MHSTMHSTSSTALRALVVSVTALLAIGGLFFGLLREEASPQARLLELFCAPSHLAPGEHWVIVGSGAKLPLDLTALANQEGVVVLETERLSARALAVRLQVPAAAAGNLLRVSSAQAALTQEVPLERGQQVPALSAASNFSAEDLAGGRLVVAGEHFLYGYLAASEGGISAVRIHNRQSGRWHRREIALEKAIRKSEALVVLGPRFRKVDPLETLPDTDGDGIFDFEEPELEEPRSDFLGVALVPGANTLDIVAVDEAQNASWELLEVFTTYTPAVKAN